MGLIGIFLIVIVIGILTPLITSLSNLLEMFSKIIFSKKDNGFSGCGCIVSLITAFILYKIFSFIVMFF